MDVAQSNNMVPVEKTSNDNVEQVVATCVYEAAKNFDEIVAAVRKCVSLAKRRVELLERLPLYDENAEIEHLALCSKDSGIKNNVKETLVEAELIESTLLSKSNKITVPVIETSPPAEAASIANGISIDRDDFEMPKEHKDFTENNASKDLTENNAENVEQLDKDEIIDLSIGDDGTITELSTVNDETSPKSTGNDVKTDQDDDVDISQILIIVGNDTQEVQCNDGEDEVNNPALMLMPKSIVDEDQIRQIEPSQLTVAGEVNSAMSIVNNQTNDQATLAVDDHIKQAQSLEMKDRPFDVNGKHLQTVVVDVYQRGDDTTGQISATGNNSRSKSADKVKKPVAVTSSLDEINTLPWRNPAVDKKCKKRKGFFRRLFCSCFNSSETSD